MSLPRMPAITAPHAGAPLRVAPRAGTHAGESPGLLALLPGVGGRQREAGQAICAYRFGTRSSGIPSALARSELTFSGTGRWRCLTACCPSWVIR